MAINIPATLVYPGTFNTTKVICSDSDFDTDVAGSYTFKVEEQQDLKYVSVAMIGVRYVNLGLGTLTVTLTGPEDSQTQTLILGDSTKTKGYYNGGTVPKANSDGRTYTAIFSFHPLTDEYFQVKLSRLANNGPLKIIKVTVFGESKEKSR